MKHRELDRYLEIIETHEFGDYKDFMVQAFQKFTMGYDYKLPTVVEFLLTHLSLNLMAMETLVQEFHELKKQLRS